MGVEGAVRSRVGCCAFLRCLCHTEIKSRQARALNVIRDCTMRQRDCKKFHTLVNVALRASANLDTSSNLRLLRRSAGQLPNSAETLQTTSPRRRPPNGIPTRKPTPFHTVSHKYAS